MAPYGQTIDLNQAPSGGNSLSRMYILLFSFILNSYCCLINLWEDGLVVFGNETIDPSFDGI